MEKKKHINNAQNNNYKLRLLVCIVVLCFNFVNSQQDTQLKLDKTNTADNLPSQENNDSGKAAIVNEIPKTKQYSFKKDVYAQAVIYATKDAKIFATDNSINVKIIEEISEKDHSIVKIYKKNKKKKLVKSKKKSYKDSVNKADFPKIIFSFSENSPKYYILNDKSKNIGVTSNNINSKSKKALLSQSDYFSKLTIDDDSISHPQYIVLIDYLAVLTCNFTRPPPSES